VRRRPLVAIASRSAASLASILVATVVAACAVGPSATQPNEALREYARALDERRIEDAYRMLSEEARRGLSLEAFRRAVVENPAEAQEIARALARPSGEARVTARVLLPSGEEVPLVLEDGAWKVEGSAVDLYGDATPRQALLGFIRAFKRKRWDVVLRYVPEEERAGGGPARSAAPPTAGAAADGAPPPPDDGGALTAAKLKAAWEGAQKDEMTKLVQALEAALPTATIEEVGDSASMAYGAGGTVSFVRERGAWKIQDF
jgi:hypothetical protein